MFTLNQLGVGMDRFHFFEKRSLRFENDEEKQKTKNDPSLTTVNDDPSLTSVNDILKRKYIFWSENPTFKTVFITLSF